MAERFTGGPVTVLDGLFVDLDAVLGGICNGGTYTGEPRAQRTLVLFRTVTAEAVCRI